MTERGPRTLDVAEEVKELGREVKGLSKDMADLGTDWAGFPSAVETELRTTRRLGAWFLGGLFAGILSVFVSVVIAAVTISWNASAVVSEVKYQGQRLQKVEESHAVHGEKVEKQLDILIRRTEAKPEG